MRIEDQRGGNGSVPGTRRKAVPIAMATGPAEYMVNWVNIRTQMLGRGPFVRTFDQKKFGSRFGRISMFLDVS
jgi:hypothetical protein